MESGTTWGEIHIVGREDSKTEPTILHKRHTTFQVGTTWKTGTPKKIWGNCYGFREDVDDLKLATFRVADPGLFAELTLLAWPSFELVVKRIYHYLLGIPSISREGASTLSRHPFAARQEYPHLVWSVSFDEAIFSVTEDEAMSFVLYHSEAMRERWLEAVKNLLSKF